MRRDPWGLSRGALESYPHDATMRKLVRKRWKLKVQEIGLFCVAFFFKKRIFFMYSDKNFRSFIINCEKKVKVPSNNFPYPLPSKTRRDTTQHTHRRHGIQRRNVKRLNWTTNCLWSSCGMCFGCVTVCVVFERGYIIISLYIMTSTQNFCQELDFEMNEGCVLW